MERKHTMAFVGLVAMIVFFVVTAGIAFTGSTDTSNYQNVAPTGRQVSVKMSMSNGVYQFDPAFVNAGDTVKITADMSNIRGCYTSVVIPDMGIRKQLTSSDNTFEFVASMPGTFSVTCSMGMARGNFVVKDASGAAPIIQNSEINSGASCGAGGGCGCGGG